MTWKSCDKSLEWSERIGKSLDGVRVRSDIKRQGFLMVHTWYMHILGD